MDVGSKVVFIEGIHGAGKSTYAKRLISRIREEKPESPLFYRNEKPSPLDLDRLAFFTDEELAEFTGICGACGTMSQSRLMQEVSGYSTREEDRCVVNWYPFSVACNCDAPHVRAFALEHEVCGGRVGSEAFRELILKRWKRFAGSFDPEAYYLFEGALFQHPLEELLGHYNLPDKEIVSFMQELINSMQAVMPKLIYIQVSDIRGTLLNAINERAGDKRPWHEGFFKWIESCEYGKLNQLSGLDGAVRYCRKRIQLEKLIMENAAVSLELIDR